MKAYAFKKKSIDISYDRQISTKDISQYTSQAIIRKPASILSSSAIRIQGSRATPPAITLLRRWSSQALEKTRGS